MKSNILLVLIKISASSRGQAPKWTDFILFGGQSFDHANSINVDRKDNYYITASSQNPLSNLFNNDPPAINCNFIQPIRNTLYLYIMAFYLGMTLVEI